MSRMMKRVNKAGKVDPGDRVTLRVANFNLLARITLSPCKQALSRIPSNTNHKSAKFQSLHLQTA